MKAPGEPGSPMGHVLAVKTCIHGKTGDEACGWRKIDHLILPGSLNCSCGHDFHGKISGADAHLSSLPCIPGQRAMPEPGDDRKGGDE